MLLTSRPRHGPTRRDGLGKDFGVHVTAATVAAELEIGGLINGLSNAGMDVQIDAQIVVFGPAVGRDEDREIGIRNYGITIESCAVGLGALSEPRMERPTGLPSDPLSTRFGVETATDPCVSISPGRSSRAVPAGSRSVLR